MSKIISEATGVFWRLTAPTRPYLKACGVANFSIFLPNFGPNLHLKPCNNHFFSFGYSCDVSKRIFEAIIVFYCHNLKVCGVAKTILGAVLAEFWESSPHFAPIL